MTFYLSNRDVGPIGFEPAEFLDLLPMAEAPGDGAPAGSLDLPDMSHNRKQAPMSMPEPTIVLVHGAFAESASWNPVIERLRHHDTTLVAAHHRGFHEIVAVANPLR